MNKNTLLALGGIAAFMIPAKAQVFADFESFATSPGNGAVLFRDPRFSGSTQSKLDAAPNISQVTATFPAGNTSTRALAATWSFSSSATDPWLRLTTSAAPNLPNPTVDINQFLGFKIYSDRTIQVAVGLRETGTSAAIGANGGATGTIEWVGASGKTVGGAPIVTRTIPAGAWTQLYFDLNGEPTAGFTGDGNVVSATGKAVLEHLALVPGDGSGTYNIFLDDFQVTPVPEPSTYALIFGVLALGGAIVRRKFQS
jgi:hypothetical protein